MPIELVGSRQRPPHVGHRESLPQLKIFGNVLRVVPSDESKAKGLNENDETENRQSQANPDRKRPRLLDAWLALVLRLNFAPRGHLKSRAVCRSPHEATPLRGVPPPREL